MTKAIVALLFVISTLGSLSAQPCANWSSRRICALAGSEDKFHETLLEELNRAYFTERFQQAREAGETTLPLSQFTRLYLPQLQRSLLRAINAEGITQDQRARLDQLIGGLPKDDLPLYLLYADFYSSEHYLYQWTCNELARLGLELPEQIRNHRLDPVLNYKELAGKELDIATMQQITSETEAHGRWQANLQCIRKYLLIAKISDAIEFESAEERKGFREYNRNRLRTIISAEYLSFANELISRSED